MSDSDTASDTAGQTSYRNIWQLSWPQVIMMLFHFIIGFVDVWVAGQINEDVQASLGLVTQSLFFFLVIGMAVANGSVAAISQSAGAGLQRRVQRYTGLVVVCGLLSGGVIFGLGMAGKELFLTLLQVPERILPVTGYFLDVYLLLLPVYYLFVVSNAVFRAQKMVHIPLGAMAVVALVNTVADLGLGLGWWGMPELGYRGVAWATLFSVSAGMLYNMLKLWRLGLLRRASFAPWRWVRAAFPYLVKVAAPSGGMQLLWHTGYMVLFAITGSLPLNSINALAGMTAGMRIESLLFLPAFAFNMTASILVGNCLGAGRQQEAKQVGLRLLGLACGSMSVVAVVMWPFVDTLAAFVAPEPAVTAQAVMYLKYNIISIPFTVASMTLGGIMTGAGATIYTFWVYSSATWLVRLPVAYVLGHLVWHGAEGIFLAMLVSQVFQSSVMFYLFMRCDWYRFSMIKRKLHVAAASSLEGTKANVRSAV